MAHTFRFHTMKASLVMTLNAGLHFQHHTHEFKSSKSRAVFFHGFQLSVLYSENT